ncbi:hypothetical protein D3C72_2040300 [compost metagenome]
MLFTVLPGDGYGVFQVFNSISTNLSAAGDRVPLLLCTMPIVRETTGSTMGRDTRNG